MASIFLQFPPPPRRSHMTVFEQEGQMKDVPDSIPVSCLPDYPEVSVQKEATSRISRQCESAQLAFLSHSQSTWKKFLHAWYSGGLVNTLEEITDSRDEVPGWILSASRATLTFVNKVLALKSLLFPQSGLSSEETLSKYSHISCWNKSPIQALAWHPHVTKLAIACRDDSVHVYYANNTLSPVLKHKLQKQVIDLAWQPMSSSVLAVACRNCVLIWHVEPTSLALRPSSSTVQVLYCRDQCPVTSIVWSPHGDHLVSASPKSTSFLVWDVSQESSVAFRRDRGGGVTLLSYSPDGSKLLTATQSALFRVWETQTWSWEVWSQLAGQCTAACWSPDGSVLIFAMEEESALYGVRFTDGVSKHGRTLSTVNTSVLLADLSQVSISAGMAEDVRIGGNVKSIVWDKTGERVAVMFEPNELGNNPFVAVFKATVHPVLELLPGGFIKGKAGESVHHIAFQPEFPQGALLSVVWSSGRVGYIPMYFVPAQQIQKHRGFQQSLRSPGSVFSPRALTAMSPLRDTL